MTGTFARGTFAALLACFLLTVRAEAQTSLEIYAGGTPFVGAPGNTVPVNPKALALAPNGDLYVADEASGKILRHQLTTSTVTSVPNLPGLLEYRFAGPQALGYGPGAALSLLANQEQWQLDLVDGFRIYGGWNNFSTVSATFMPDGSMYFSRYNDHAVFRRTASGGIEAVAGSMLPGFSGDGTTSALLLNPRGVAVDAAGNVYIADSGNNRVRRRAAGTGVITTVAGTGLSGYNGDNLLALQTNLSNPTQLALDAAGNLYINEADGFRIRRLNAANGRIVTFAGTGSLNGDTGNGGPAINAMIYGVTDMKVAGNGTLYIAEPSRFRVRKVDTNGIINHVIGNGTRAFCGEEVPAREACLYRPNGLTIDDAGDVYFSDQYNGRIRKISATTGLITTIAGARDYGPDGDGGPALLAPLYQGPAGIAVDAARNLYVAVNGRVRRIDAATQIISAYAGTTTPGFSGDGGPAVAAQFNGVSRVALDSSGNLYISDIYNNRVRRVDAATGIITTVAGNGSSTGPLGDGGPAINASLGWPHNLAFDPDGNLLIGDTNHYRIRKVNLATGVITTVAGNGVYGINGDGGPANAAGIGSWPAFDVDSGGNIYVTAGFQLRRIDAQTGIIDEAPAPIWGLYTPEGRGLENPNDMVLGPDNRLYITDAATNNLVLRVSGLPTPASDLTPPVIEPVVSGTPGNNGWYRSNVQIAWSVTDAESAVTTTAGCAQSQVTWDTEGAEFYCIATSEGGTAERRVTIRKDSVAPQLTFASPSPAPDASGWNSTDVSFQFSIADATSGVFSISTASPVTVSGAGSNRTASVVLTDSAGNSATFTTPAVNIDRSAPVVSPNVSGTLGNNGWYTSDVAVSWTTTDDGAPVSSTEGCDETSVTADTAGVTFTCTASSAGGSTTQLVTVKRDATAPQLEFGVPSPAANAAGWHSGDVSIPFTVTDATSGVATTSSSNPVVITGPGANLSSNVVVTDGAGNSATFTSPAVNILSLDSSPPVVTPNVSGTAGNNGWYRSTVQVSWSVSDAESEITSTSGCTSNTVTEDTAGIEITCTATSAGGTTTQTVVVKKDTNAPVATFDASFPAPNAAGWNNSNVSHPYTLTDTLSGVSGTTQPSPVVVSAEGTSVTAQFSVTDLAGNSTSITTPPVRIDLTPPTINIVNPVQGTNYGAFSTLNAQYTCADSLSTPATCTGTVPSGTPIATNTSGSKTFTVTATDAAGNQATASRTYTVAAMVWNGWVALRRSEILNRVPPGSLVPIRWFLTNGLNQPVSNLAAFQSITVQTYNCANGGVTIPLSDTATGGPGLTYSASTKAFTYNWQTDASWAGSCRRVLLNFANNTSSEVLFRFQ